MKHFEKKRFDPYQCSSWSSSSSTMERSWVLTLNPKTESLLPWIPARSCFLSIQVMVVLVHELQFPQEEERKKISRAAKPRLFMTDNLFRV